ncbi:PucR family transcriptional regulator [Leucothrix sargassi]|nr:PucR family transcriptional regulator [Leucothrix sargassi]
MIKIQSLPNITGLEAITLRTDASSNEGLIRWPYIAESTDIGDWINGGELIFVTGQNWQWQPDDFIYLIKVAKEKHASGLVILTQSPYIERIPQAVLDFANEQHFAVFEQPYSLPMVKVTELLSNAIIKADLCNQSIRWLLQQLVESTFPPSQITLARAKEFELDAHATFSMAVVVPDIKQTAELERYQFLLNQCLVANNSPLPLLEYHQGWLLCLPYISGRESDAIAQWKALNEQLKALGFNCNIGISRAEGLQQFSGAASQAKQSAEFAIFQGNNTLVHFQDLGINQLFAGVEERNKLKVFCQQNLGELYASFDKQSALLKNTLACYFEQLCSSRLTASTLGIHRNTLSYRLKRIEAITGNSLGNAQQRLCLQNALVMEKLTLASSHHEQANALHQQ